MSKEGLNVPFKEMFESDSDTFTQELVSMLSSLTLLFDTSKNNNSKEEAQYQNHPVFTAFKEYSRNQNMTFTEAFQKCKERLIGLNRWHGYLQEKLANLCRMKAILSQAQLDYLRETAEKLLGACRGDVENTEEYAIWHAVLRSVEPAAGEDIKVEDVVSFCRSTLHCAETKMLVVRAGRHVLLRNEQDPLFSPLTAAEKDLMIQHTILVNHIVNGLNRQLSQADAETFRALTEALEELSKKKTRLENAEVLGNCECLVQRLGCEEQYKSRLADHDTRQKKDM